MPDGEALERRMRALEARVRAVEDAQAIQNLKSRYAQILDRRYTLRGPVEAAEVERLAREAAALFTEDAVWDGGKALGVAKGREEIARRFAEPTLAFAWHYFVKPEIAVDGDRARATWDVLSPCTTRDGRPHWMAGAEDDEYERVDGVWLHSRMVLRVVFLAPHETGWQLRT